jgi:alpha-mannosidase
MEPISAINIDSATPTPLFANAVGQPQLVNVSVSNSGNPGQVTFTARTNGAATTTLDVPSGASDQQVDVIPASAPGPADLAITSSAGGSIDIQLPYQRRWQLYVIHGSHQDIGYAGLPPAIRLLQEQYIDTAVQECQATAQYPADARFRWTFEHAWTLENYIADRSPAQVQAVASCLRTGQFELAGSYDNQLYDLDSPEQMARALKYSGERDFLRMDGTFGLNPC